jgi:hypothetical protein
MRLIPTKVAAGKLRVHPKRIEKPSRPQEDTWFIAFHRPRLGSYFLCTHGPSLYSLVVPGSLKLSELVLRIATTCGLDAMPFCIEYYVNRAVVGSMNDMKKLIEATDPKEGSIDCQACEEFINRTPFSYLSMNRPKDLFRSGLNSGSDSPMSTLE